MDHKTKGRDIAELILDVVCLAASYGILFFLPGETAFLLYLMLGISAFLFCVGFFRLGFLFRKPFTRRGELISQILFVLGGIVINAAGVLVIIRGEGGGRSIMIAVILLIEAMLFYSIAGSKCGTLSSKWRASVLFRAAAVLLGIGSAAAVVLHQFSEISVIVGGYLIIELICLWAMGSGNDPFQSRGSNTRIVPKMKLPIPELVQVLSGTETQLGRPWLGKMRSLRNDTILYGPSDSGSFVYGYYHFGRFCFTYGKAAELPDPAEAAKHTVAEIPDSRGTLLAPEILPDAYAEMLERYMKTGTVTWDAAIGPKTARK